MEVADRPTTPWSSAILREVAAGEVLVHEGGRNDDVFTVVEGCSRSSAGRRWCIDTVGPGATIGEIAALAGCPRTATVRALEPSIVRQLGGDAHQQWLANDEPAMLAMVDIARSRIDRHRTIGLVTELLAIDLTLAAQVVESSEASTCVPATSFSRRAMRRMPATSWSAVLGGEPGRHRDRRDRPWRGRRGMIERAPRGATVTALRDSTLARFSADAFRALTSAHHIDTGPSSVDRVLAEIEAAWPADVEG